MPRCWWPFPERKPNLQLGSFLGVLIFEAALFWLALAPGLEEAFGFLAVLCVQVLFVATACLAVRLWLTEPGHLPQAFEVQCLLATSEAQHKHPKELLEILYAEAFAQAAAADPSLHSSAETPWLKAAVCPPPVGGPEILPGNLRWCRQCKIWEPEACMHCSDCQRCCLGWQNHCMFLGMCVGRRNGWRLFTFALCGASCSVSLCVISFVQLSIQFMSSEIPPLSKPLPEIDSQSLVKYRLIAVQVVCAALLFKFGTSFLGMAGRYYPFFGYAKRALTYILCPGIFFQLAMLFILGLALHMISHGTLEKKILAVLVSFVTTQTLVMISVGSTFEALTDLVRKASKNIKDEAGPMRNLKELVPLSIKEFVHFFTAPTPPSVLPQFPAATGGANVVATLHGRPAPSYAHVPTDDDA